MPLEGSTIALAGFLTELQDISGLDGYTLQATPVNPTVSVDIPFYSPYRFLPARRLTDFRQRIDWDAKVDQQIVSPTIVISGQTLDDTGETASERNMYVQTAVAVGDDFTVVMFIGAPPMFYEVDIP